MNNIGGGETAEVDLKGLGKSSLEILIMALLGCIIALMIVILAFAPSYPEADLAVELVGFFSQSSLIDNSGWFYGVVTAVLIAFLAIVSSGSPHHSGSTEMQYARRVIAVVCQISTALSLVLTVAIIGHVIAVPSNSGALLYSIPTAIILFLLGALASRFTLISRSRRIKFLEDQARLAAECMKLAHRGGGSIRMMAMFFLSILLAILSGALVALIWAPAVYQEWRIELIGGTAISGVLAGLVIYFIGDGVVSSSLRTGRTEKIADFSISFPMFLILPVTIVGMSLAGYWLGVAVTTFATLSIIVLVAPQMCRVVKGGQALSDLDRSPFSQYVLAKVHMRSEKVCAQSQQRLQKLRTTGADRQEKTDHLGSSV